MDKKALRWFAIAMLLCLCFQLIAILLRFCGVVVYPWTMLPGCLSAAVVAAFAVCYILDRNGDDNGGFAF